MAAVNIISTTAIYGKTQADWATTSFTAILNNAVDSNEILRINSLFISNVNNTDADISVELYRSGIGFKIANSVPVGAKSTAVIIGKDTSIYLEEGDTLRISASQSNTLQYVISYEVMS